jgi:predicted MPP superfamily phosphohydrolase
MGMQTSISQKLWDLWCILSVIGIWPRFIEPSLIKTTWLKLYLSNLPDELRKLTILQFSDFHFHSTLPRSFTTKLCNKVSNLKPDLIVFSGDILCYSNLEDKERLKQFLNSFHAPYGCYAVLGNHDYQESVSINSQGDYDIVKHPSSSILKGFKRLYRSTEITKKVTERARNVDLHGELIELLKQTPFELLHNETKVVKIKNAFLNICGVGEHMLDRCHPEIAYQNYKVHFPGIILAHNPDCLPKLANYPGDVILCGHTHGGQINLPWLWKSFTLMEDARFKRGLHKVKDKWMYVNRGIGGVMPFRWFSLPELLFLTLDKQ